MADRDALTQLYLNRNQLLQNAQTSVGPGRVVPPLPTTLGLTHPSNSFVTSTAASTNALPRNNRRAATHMQNQYLPSGTYNGQSTYNNRPYVNINAYNPYNTLGQSLGQFPPLSQLPQFQNPIVIAAAENSRPAFEHIHSVVQSFSSISMMLESTYYALQLSHNAILSVAENFTRLKLFITKLYSAIISVKLARWFLIKIMQLIDMVTGQKRSSNEEHVWASLSTNVVPSAERTWPIVAFASFLAITPIFLFKALLSKATNSVVKLSIDEVLVNSYYDWNIHSQMDTISVVKGRSYITTNKEMMLSTQNGGWIYVKDFYGHEGYAPIKLFINTHKNDNTQSIMAELSNVTAQDVLAVNQNEVNPKQIQPQSTTTVQIPVKHNNPVIPSQPLTDFDELENRKN